MARRNVQANIAEYFGKHPGETIYLDDLILTLNLDKKATLSAVATIIRLDKLPGLEIIYRARAWRYTPGKKVSKSAHVFEELARTKNGDLVLQDDQGALYRATELV